MDKEILTEKVRECTSGIEMLRMKEYILEHLGEKKKPKKVMKKEEGVEE